MSIKTLDNVKSLQKELDTTYAEMSKMMALANGNCTIPGMSTRLVGALEDCGVTIQVRDTSINLSWPMPTKADPDWSWKMDWCRVMRVSPGDFWTEAGEACASIKLLKAAARKAELDVVGDNFRALLVKSDHSTFSWNSLDADSDAYSLLAQLQLSVEQSAKGVISVYKKPGHMLATVAIGKDRSKSLRRAITLAAIEV
jgi:hypothetical protein